MNIVFGADYKCLSQRDDLVAALEEFGRVVDVVKVDPALQDYVEVSQQVARRIVEDPAARGVLICGTGIGISIVANKYDGVYAARCVTVQDAVDGRTINNANVVCLSVGTPIEVNREIVRAFMRTAFPGDERRVRRLEKIVAMEGENFK